MAPLYKKLLNGQHNLIFKVCQENFMIVADLIEIEIGLKR